MDVIVADLGPYTVTLEIETPEGIITLMNTSERLEAMLHEPAMAQE